MILCIDTAIEMCSVGICWDAEMIDSIDNESSMRASEVLHQMINDLLERNKISAVNLKAVAVNGGPGSYTGLRIGASSAKGICYALDIPLIHISSLELMLEGIIERKGMNDFDFYIPMIDARRNEVFTAVYDGNRKQILTPQPMILEEGSFSDYSQSRSIFFGNGTHKAEQILDTVEQTLFSELTIIARDFRNLAWKKWLNKDFEDSNIYTPSYLKKFYTTALKSS